MSESFELTPSEISPTLARPRWVIAGFVAMALAQAADAFTFTLTMSQTNLWVEQNPLVRALYQVGGPFAPIALKAAVIGGIMVVLVRFARYDRFLAISLAIGTFAGVVGAVSNLWSYALLAQMTALVGHLGPVL